MTQTRDESPLSRTELVVLACLSQAKPPSAAALAKAVQPICLPDEAPGRARELTADVVGALRRRALVHERKLRLTDDGGRALCRELGLARTPTWPEVRDVHLAALALGLAPGSEAARAVRGAATIVPAVLRTRFGVPEASTVTLLCDALLAEAVGLPPVPTTLEQLRAHVLARRVGIEPRGKLLQLAGRAAMLVVGARPGRGAIAKALGRHWARGNPDPTGARVAYTVVRDAAPHTPTPQRPGARQLELVGPTGELPRAPAAGRTGIPATPAAGRPEVLLEVVRDAVAQVGAEGRFGSENVYVSAIWRSLERDHGLADLSLERFKRWLVSANRDGWLVLARADLIGAMDPRQVAESEIEDRGATFHFVLDQRGDAVASQRGNHV